MENCESNCTFSDTVVISENGRKCQASATGSSGIEETSPDLLRNTPSNIRRLEDEIEQCKGRQKYLAQTRSPSDGGDVRWYYCKVPLAENELAASVPRSEIVGKSEYFRFGMRDSLAIEASFLQREEELLSSWWREYAECSEGPSGRPKKASSPESDQSPELFAVEEERVGVPVKGGLYEVDLVKRHCFPVYWDGENRRVLRGHWFARKGGLDWLPLREDVAEQLEFAYRSQVWHRRTFQPSGLFAARVELQGSTVGLHALFTGEDDTWEAWLNVDASGFSTVMGIGGNGIKLRRGYSTSESPKPTQDELRQQKEEEMDDYCSQVPVRHVVFMVHGIGQRLEKSNLVDDVGSFRELTTSLAEHHLTSYQRDNQRILYIPCQWRRSLKLSGESAVEKITLDGVRGLRVMLSATVHDVLYYMSPVYCQDIINSVSNQLNRLYLKFLKRNPGYDGKVSIYGHSLGSVLSYDILCHQENLSSPVPMDWMYKEDRTEESPPNLTNQSSECKFTYLEDTNPSAGNNEIKDGMRGIEDIRVSAQECELINESVCAENSFTSVEPPATSDFLEQPNRSLEEDIHVSSCESSNTVPQQRDGLDETTCTKCGDIDGSEETAEQVSECMSNEERTIRLLREEIDSLKAKIAELELQCGAKDTRGGLHQGNGDVDINASKQPLSEKLPSASDDRPRSYTPYIKYTKLIFKVDTFFAVGSPLGVFLALRNVRIGIGKGQEYWDEENIIEEMPACRQMFNIFHPFDPVAYRVEPLICKEYTSKRPVIIPYHKGGKRLHIGLQEFAEDLSASSHAIIARLNFVRVKVLTACQTRNRDSLEEAEEKSEEKEERSYGSIMIERLTGSPEGRIDHVLQDKTFEHAYISAIGSHTSYWRDYDTALFILKHLYLSIPREPHSAEDSKSRGLKDESASMGWTDQGEASEDLPLTFSDKSKPFPKKA